MLTEDGSQSLESQEKLWYNELFSTFRLIFISFITGKLNAPLSRIICWSYFHFESFLHDNIFYFGSVN